MKASKMALTMALVVVSVVNEVKAQSVFNTVRAYNISADTDHTGGEPIRFFTSKKQVAYFLDTGSAITSNISFNKKSYFNGNVDHRGKEFFYGNVEHRGREAFHGNIIGTKIGLGTYNPKEAIHLYKKNFRLDNGEFQSHGEIVLHPDVDNTGDDKVSFRNGSNKEMANLQDGSLFLTSFRYNKDIGGIIKSNGPLVLHPGNDNTGDDMISFRNGLNKEMANLQDGILTLDQIRLNVTTFPDYVFNKDYNLMPLSEVASFINRNKHLPNMPSEVQVIKEGMNVGQINKILVEKVEELTLYAIEQEQKLNKQKEQFKKILDRLFILEKNITNKKNN